MAQVKSGDEDKNRKITTRTDEKRTKGRRDDGEADYIEEYYVIVKLNLTLLVVKLSNDLPVLSCFLCFLLFKLSFPGDICLLIFLLFQLSN